MEGPGVHVTGFGLRHVEHEGFEVIVDDEDHTLTDMKLLAYLRHLRFDIAKEDKKKPYQVIGNKGLVSLATFRPQTREEFIDLYGLGEKTYESYGARFIEAIKEYENSDSPSKKESPR